LLYVRAFVSEAGEDEGEAASQWLIAQCALVAPVYVTRLFAPTAVLVKYETAAVAESAFAALRGRVFVQFAVEPCNIVSGAEAFNIAAYHERLMRKEVEAAGGASQPDPFSVEAFSDFSSSQQRGEVIVPEYRSLA